MSQPVRKVLGLLELLQAHPAIGGRDLAGRLGVDERTVRRYAATLTELGVPVTAARGRYGGYRLAPAYRLPPLMFTDDEAVAVVLGLVAADRMGLTTGRPAAGTALAKLRRVLPPALAGRVAALEESLDFTRRRPDRAAGPDTGVLLELGAATAQHRAVALAYRSWRGDESRRELDPYGLVFHAGRWYVTGLDHASGEIRTFRLDRIGSVTRLDRAFTVPDGFDPVARVTEGLASVAYAHEVEILLATTLDEARRVLPPTVGTLTAADGGVVLRCRAERLDGMARMIAGWPWRYTVIRPDALRGALLAHAARVAADAAATLTPDG